MKTFTIGDIHGNYAGLKQCIEKSNIDKDKDTLIVLGDVVDGWNEVPECVEELLTFKNLIGIIGNHDFWFMEWAKTRHVDLMWFKQGGQATLESYKEDDELTDRHMKEYFSKLHYYYIDIDRNYAFMHGGYDWHMPLSANNKNDIMWDRHMVETAQTWKFEKHNAQGGLLKFPEFDKIFVGHTTTQWKSDRRYTPSTKPAFLANLINMDTGAGWDGKLTLMDIDILEYWQSDLCSELYPNQIITRY